MKSEDTRDLRTAVAEGGNAKLGWRRQCRLGAHSLEGCPGCHGVALRKAVLVTDGLGLPLLGACQFPQSHSGNEAWGGMLAFSAFLPRPAVSQDEVG